MESIIFMYEWCKLEPKILLM